VGGLFATPSILAKRYESEAQMEYGHKKSIESYSLLAHLIKLAESDTLYRDEYIRRARHYLEPQLSPAGYSELKKMQLTSRNRKIKQQLNDKIDLTGFGHQIYGHSDIPIDPFSPGMHKLANLTTDQLDELRTTIIFTLKELSKADSDWKAFYSDRLAAFTALTINANSIDNPSQTTSSAVLEDEAAEALESGNMARLELLAKKLSKGTMSTDSPAARTDLLQEIHQAPAEYRYEFSPQTINAAQKLGLEFFSVPSRNIEFEPFSRFMWHPTFAVQQGNHKNVIQVPDLPKLKGLPEALKSRIQLFAIHPFINSAGIRYLPSIVAEDVLVENFPEPEAGAPLPSSGLLEALGFKQRNQLTRQQIEAVLLEKGSEIVQDELGLDPKEFKLVCIPPDLHLRIGLERGWGQQQIWTHFDGYMIMADASHRALAGGDVRYGGIYDLLGLSCSYDSERIIARFAVVQRRRMAVWL
jgi:hypothetical protein